jgi:membrane fusion protein, heavy metal efflux system
MTSTRETERMWNVIAKKHLLALALCAAAQAGMLGCRREAKAAEAAPASASAGQADSSQVVLPVAEQKEVLSLTTVQQTEEAEMLRFPGKIVLPDNETWRVGVLLSGRIERVYANLGDYVQKGEVLARMHSHDVHEARASYAMAKAEETRSAAAATLAQVNLDRIQRLHNLKAASVEQMEQARQELVNANTALDNAKTDVLRNRVHLEENLGIPAEAPLEGTNEENDLVPIVTPASGYILQKEITPGATIGPGSDAFVIGNLNHLWMLASVGQESLPKIHIGQEAQVTLPGLPGATFTGRVANLGQAFDPTTRRLQIRIQIETSSSLLHPEMLANASIAAGGQHPAILIDPSAVQQINGQDVVFIRVTNDRFEMRAIRTGDPVGDKITVAEGLRPGEKVVTQGAFLLKSQLLRSAMQGD